MKLNKQVFFFYAIFCSIIIFASIVIAFRQRTESNSPTSSALPVVSSTPVAAQVFTDANGEPMYTYGNCATSSECVPAGCSSHICSNDPNIITDCALPPVIPAQEGYSCGCVQSQCVWHK